MQLLARWLKPGSSEEHGQPITIDYPLHRFIEGLVPRNASGDPTNDITFGVGRCSDSTRAQPIIATAERTKQANATWAAGDNAGMHPGGSATAWGAGSFHLFVLGKRTDLQAFEFGMDSSATAANLMANAAVVSAGFDLFRRVAGFKTTGAAWQTVKTRANGAGELLVKYTVPTNDWNTTTSGTSAVTRTLNTPAGIVVRARVWWRLRSSAGNQNYGLITSLDMTDGTPSASNHSMVAGAASTATNVYTGAEFEVDTDTASAIRTRSGQNEQSSGMTQGWVDERAD